MTQVKKASPCRDRKVTCFPSKKYNALIKAYADWNDISISKAGSIAIKYFIDQLPAEQKAKIETALNEADPSK